MANIARSAFMIGLIALAVGSAAAQETKDLSDNEVTHRLNYIQGALDEGEQAAKLWWYGWLLGYSGATAAQLAIRSSTDDEELKQDMLVGAATTAVGAAGQILLPMDPARWPGKLRAMPGDTPEARRAKLATAEDYLERCAERERFGRSWKAHALSGLVNLAGGLAIGLRDDRPASDGLVTFAVNQLIAELQIFTQPKRAIRDQREYEQRSDWSTASTSGGGGRRWGVGVQPGGFVVAVSF